MFNYKRDILDDSVFFGNKLLSTVLRLEEN